MATDGTLRVFNYNSEMGLFLFRITHSNTHTDSQQLSSFSLCFSGLISALLVLSAIYLFMKVSLSPDIILCGLLGLKHQLTNLLNCHGLGSSRYGCMGRRCWQKETYFILITVFPGFRYCRGNAFRLCCFEEERQPGEEKGGKVR